MTDSEPSAEQDPSTPPSLVPPPVALWVMRGLAIVGLILAGLLVYAHMAPTLGPWLAGGGLSCSWAPDWLAGCESALNHPRWSKVVGVPVSVPALAVYAMLAVGLLMLSPKRSAAARRQIWWVLDVGAAAVALAAVWFIGLQLIALDDLCFWCMSEHTVGLILAGLITWYGTALGVRGASRRIGPVVGALLVAGMVGGQLLVEPSYSDPLDRILLPQELAASAGDGEAGADQQGLRVDRRAHPLLGNPDAPRLIIEAVDFTCPRCRQLYERMESVWPKLTDRYAVLVLTTPLNTECNRIYARHYEFTEERHRDACYFAELAQAVAIAAPEAYPEFHRWLFAHQEELTREGQDNARQIARSHAEQLVDPSRLEEVLAGEEPMARVRRDVKLGAQLRMTQLPGLLAGGRRFTAIPESGARLLEQLDAAFDGDTEGAEGSQENAEIAGGQR